MRPPIRFLLPATLLIFCQLTLVGQTNHNFAKWEREIAAYERTDASHPPAKGSIVFIGSSTIARWQTLAQDFAGQPVLNRGFGGSEIVDSTHFADRIIFPYEPKLVFLRAGGNDLWGGKAPEQVFGDFKEFVAKVHARLPQTDIVFISLCPTPARWSQHERERLLNRLIAEFMVGKAHLKYINTFEMALGEDGKPRPELFVEDKLHFNAAGYQLLAARVHPYLPY